MKKPITASLFLLTLVSCSNAVQPISTSAPTFEAFPSATPTETLQAFSSDTPTFEAAATAMPDPGDVLDPQGSPVQEWRGIPIMPEAVAGQEFTPDNAYSFKVNTSIEEVQDFYTETLSELGWSQPFESSFDANGGMINFRKEGSSLTITVTPSEDSVVVLFVLVLA